MSPTWNMIWKKVPRLLNTSYVPELTRVLLLLRTACEVVAVTPFLAYTTVRLGENEEISPMISWLVNSGARTQNCLLILKLSCITLSLRIRK